MGKSQTAKESKHQAEEFRLYYTDNRNTKVFKWENINQYTGQTAQTMEAAKQKKKKRYYSSL